MAANALSILSGIGAAAAGLAGEKVSKSGAIPGLDIGSIITALLGSKAGGGGSKILGAVTSVASIASKTGLLKDSKLGNLAELAGTLLSTGSASKSTAKTGIAGLAASILGGSGSGANLASIAASALKLGKTAEDEKSLIGMATELGKTLCSKGGVSVNAPASAVNGLSKVLGDDIKTTLFTSVLKGIMK